jgi:hypothetical protein
MALLQHLEPLPVDACLKSWPSRTWNGVEMSMLARGAVEDEVDTLFQLATPFLSAPWRDPMQKSYLVQCFIHIFTIECSRVTWSLWHWMISNAGKPIPALIPGGLNPPVQSLYSGGTRIFVRRKRCLEAGRTVYTKRHKFTENNGTWRAEEKKKTI